MKAIYLTLSIVLISLRLVAQQTTDRPPALEFRDVTGIVRDENEDPIAGVTVTLKSPLDSMVTTTNTRGLFSFKQVKRASFYISVSRPGHPAKTALLYNNDREKLLVLTPIDYGTPKATELREVMINGKPTITYKQDTVEYKAIDYKIRPGDTLDELLKKMDGFDIDKTGTITYKGEIVGKGRLNGQDFLGGNASQMAKSLPADIIEKAQVVDYYGEQAAKTGIKDTEPVKMLNVTTKADRSVGTTINTSAQGGNDKRYNANISALHINANRQIGLGGRISNSQVGVAQGTSGGGGAGITFSANPSLSYSDHWAKTDLTASYNYNYTDNNTIQKQFGEIYTAGATPDVKNTSYFTAENINNNINEGHRASLNYSHTFDKANNIQITPNFNYSNGTVNTSAYNDRINNYTGFEHLTTNATTSNNNSNTTYGISGFYQHIFKDPRRNLSVQMGINSTDTKQNGRQYNTISFFADETQNNKLRADSVANLQTRRTSNNTTFNTTVTYLEPLTNKSQIEFSGNINRNAVDNVAKQDTVLPNGQLQELTRLSNIFNYTFTETRLRLNYTYTTNRVTVSAGASMLPTTLTGTMVNNNNNQTVSSSLNNFRVIPVFLFSYLFSGTEKATISYSGRNTIPDFQQIQPFTDISNPIYITTGNPNLKPTFTNNISASYNKYIADSKISISITVNASDIKNRVVPNQILKPGIKVGTAPDRFATVYETTYVNLDGSYALSSNYSFSKQLADKRYNLMFNGSVSYSDNVAMNNNLLYRNTVWRVYQRFGPKINTETIEFNPYIGYDVQRSFTTLASRSSTNLETMSLAVDGRFFFGDWRPNYSVSKNFVKGLGSLNTNPLIINAGIEKQLSKKNSLFLTFNVFDILKQNNFVQQNITPQGFTNTLSNTLSRYFMIGLRANFQHWGGRPKRNGEELKRKGDGSFIY